MNEIIDEEIPNNKKKHQLNPWQLRKVVIQRTEEFLEQQIPKSEILDTLVVEYGKVEETLIAKVIVGTLSKSDLKKYTLFKNSLFALLVFSILGTTYSYYNSFLNSNFNPILIIFFIIFLSIDISLILGLIKNRGENLYSILFISVFKFSDVLSLFNEAHQITIPFVIFNLGLLLQFILALTYKQKAFPSLTYKGVKKDATGAYEF